MYENIFYGVENGSYIEIGACDGLMATNTKFFEDTLGWTGILIEANPYQGKDLQKNRPNNKIFRCLVSDLKRECDFKCIKNESISGVVDTMPDGHENIFNSEINYWKRREKKVIKLIPRTMQSIIDEAAIGEIDLLSLDVEGHELNVLRSIDFSKSIINVILVEMLNGNKELDDIRQLLKNNNYVFHSKVGRNELYVLKTFTPTKM